MTPHYKLLFPILVQNFHLPCITCSQGSKWAVYIHQQLHRDRKKYRYMMLLSGYIFLFRDFVSTYYISKCLLDIIPGNVECSLKYNIHCCSLLKDNKLTTYFNEVRNCTVKY